MTKIPINYRNKKVITKIQYLQNIYQNIAKMKKNELVIQKKNFITTSKDNILHHYDFHPKELGRGAYGIVYKAKQKDIDGPWRAVKKIPKKSIKQPELLINQIQILKLLDHPAIVRLYECYQDEKNLFLVTDLCDGGQLFDRLQSNGNFSQHDARIIFRQMIEGINYCHHQKVAHRDLKPENFLFLNKNTTNLKLIDFGLSYQWKQSMKKEIDQKKQKKLIGTSYYIAPEIIEGSYDQRCDIWSLGVILYILVTAVPPFDGDDDKQIIGNVKKLKYDINIPEMQGVSSQCKDLIQKILVPAEKRISIDQIFNHPWMLKQLSDKPLKVSFNKVQNFAKFSKLKKLAATYIASRMSQKDVQQLGKLFKQIDLNHDGQISIEQLKIALSDQKNKATLQQLKEIMESIDTDKNGRLNYTQFLAFAMQKQKIFKQQNIKAVFRMLDKDGNGFVQKAQLQQVFKQNGLNDVNGKSLDQLISSCDKDGNGIIDYNQFKAAMTD